MKLLISVLLVLVAVILPARGASLSLREAEETAVKNHPRIGAAQLQALAARERTRQVQSAYFPVITGFATAVGTGDPNTRIAAGALSNPGIFDRQADGVSFSQLLTDFGRTPNLVRSSKLRARAEAELALAAEDQLRIQVDAAYFGVLEAEAIRQVAQETIKARQALERQVSTLASNKLKSDLDVSFADVALQEGRLLLSRAENELQSSYLNLSVLLGDTGKTNLQLSDEPLQLPGMADASALAQQALDQRPELASARLQKSAADSQARAEKSLRYPVISAFGSAGVIPIRDSRFREDYAAGGVNLSLPIFTGGQHAARLREAELLALAAGERVREQENLIIRDVRITLQNVTYAADKLNLSRKLAASAGQAQELATARYNIGATSIVELSQAQLAKTTADIGLANATFDYQIQIATLNYVVGRPNKSGK